MKVYVRRVGATAGFLFGFGLLTVVLASNASADEQERPPLGELTAVLSPVGSILEPAAPAVRAGADALAPVVRPLTEAIAPLTEPVLRPVVGVVTPVLDAVAPVTEPLVGPLLDAAEPVTEPVTEATGLTEAVSAVSGEKSETVVPQERALPVPLPTPLLVEEVAVLERPAAAPRVAPVEMPVVLSSVESVPMVGSDSPDDPPGYPVGPVNGALSTGSVVGSGGSHGADAAMSAPGARVSDDTGSGRSPPGSLIGQPWFGYDDRDCPS